MATIGLYIVHMGERETKTTAGTVMAGIRWLQKFKLLMGFTLPHTKNVVSFLRVKKGVREEGKNKRGFFDLLGCIVFYLTLHQLDFFKVF